jgi:dolichyldiphosphatase
LIWFLIVQYLMTPCFPWITSSRLAEFFMLRDYTSIPNAMWFDYTHARGEANNRLRKMSRSKQQ